MSHEKLKEHLPFIVEMIESVKTVDFRQKWQNMKDLIESNKLTSKQIETIELNIKKAKELKEQYKRTIVTVAPVVKIDEKTVSLQKESSLITSKTEKIEVKSKQQKELKRLYENIVKDGSPLPSKRRSAQKRSYRDSLEFLLEKSPTRSQEKKTKSETLEKAANANKRKSEAAEEINKSKEESSVQQNARKKLKSPETISEPKVLPANNKKSRGAPRKIDKSLDEDIPKDQKELDKMVETKKSTIKKFKRKIQKHQKKEIGKKRNRANLLTKGATIKSNEKVEDDEWEDLDETLEDIAPEKPTKKKALKVVEEPEKPVEKPTVRVAEFKPQNEPKTEGKTVIDVEPKSLHPVAVKKVQNISYIPCKTGFIFKCLVTGCKFLSKDNPAFVDHIENEHLTTKWDGQCDICNDKVDKTRSIIFELMHMRECHVLKENIDFPKKEASPTPQINTKPKEESKAVENVAVKVVLKEKPEEKPKTEIKPLENVKIVGKKIDIGKIKLKPIASLVSTPPAKVSPHVEVKLKDDTSDYSRSNSSQSEASPSPQKKITVQIVSNKDIQSSSGSKPEPTQVENPSVNKIVKHVIVKPPRDQNSMEVSPKPKEHTVQINKRAKPNEKVVKPKAVETQKDQITPDLLRPWLKRKLKKYLMPTTRFLDSVAAIMSTYKCMSSKCSFFTSDPKLFATHLKLHEAHMPGDRDYINCAYCDYIFADAEGPDSVIEHISTEHCYDKYQCRYCFYRSCVSLNVINHQKIFHPMKPKSIYEVANAKSRNYEQELTMIRKTRTKYVPPLLCVKCGAKFYLFSKLTAHMQTHGPNIKTKCTRCSEVSDLSNIHTHLINCHKLGLYQCVFCNFGTNSFDVMVDHIGNAHSSKPPIYCERSSEKPDAINPSLIDSTSLKFLTQQVDHRIISIPKVNPEVLRNESNVTDLGGNVKIKRVQSSSASPVPNKTPPTAKTSTPHEITVKIAPPTQAENSKSNKTQALQINKPNMSHFLPFKSKCRTSHLIKKVPAESSNSQDSKAVEQAGEALKETKKVMKIMRKSTPEDEQKVTSEKGSGLQIKSVYSLNNSN